MGLLILVRHGETELNNQNIYFGRLNPDLTDIGIEESKNAKKILKNIVYDTIYTSDLKRAYKTAEIINYNNIELKIDKRLRELDFGIFEGYSYDELFKLYPEQMAKSQNNWKEYNFETGESIVDLQKRVIDFINKELDLTKNNILVTHWGVVNSILSYYFSNGVEGYWKFNLKNGGVAIIEFLDNFPILKGFNIGAEL